MEQENIYLMDTQELWHRYLSILEETDTKQENKKNTEYIKHGIKEPIPIWYIINEWYEIYPRNKRVKIHGYGKIPISNFMDEKEKRDTIMRQIIDHLQNEGETTRPRN